METDEHAEFLDELMENAGDWDGDISETPEDTAVRYVRHLEQRVEQLAGLASEIISSFTKTDAGYRARVGQVQIGKWRDRIEDADA